MDANAATRDVSSKDPNMPPMVRMGDLLAPKAPQDFDSAGLEETVLTELALKLAYTAARVTTEWVAKRLHLSLSLSAVVLEQLCREALLEETLRTAEGRSHYKITNRGREHAGRVMEVSRYIGPAPVRLEAYAAMLRWQFASTPQVQPQHVNEALSTLVLTTKAKRMAGLAVSSGRSLFVYGPSGNGKTSLGRQIHGALSGDYWIPHCISVGNNVIRVFDEQVHQRADTTGERPSAVDLCLGEPL